MTPEKTQQTREPIAKDDGELPDTPPQASPSAAHSEPPGKRPRRKSSRRQRRLRVIAILLGLPLLLCASYWLVGIVAFADSASLIELKGMVQTRHEDDSRWDPGRLNQVLWRKDRVRTGEGSGARLLFFDVTSVDLDENTEISLMRVAKRRGGNAVDIVLKTWVGKMGIRAVRFVDPSSTFRIDTPTASTVVRGARFTLEVTESGTTQIDIEEGTAQVQLEHETVTIGMGERITLEPSGSYQTERIFEPDAQPIIDEVSAAWAAPQDTMELELTETEVNQFLAAMGEDADFFLRDTQVWFVPDEMRIATTVAKPARFDLSAAVRIHVEDGRIRPQVRQMAAGIALPVPAPILDLAIETILGQMEEYLTQAYSFVAFDEIQIKDGYALVLGHKRADAPDIQ